MTRGRSPAAALAAALAVPHLPHLDDVYSRVTHVMGRCEPDAVALRLAAVVHELPPARVRRLLVRAGHANVAPLVVVIVAGFGEVWKLDTPAALARYVRRHQRRLRALLLFEVAHEGGATSAMRAVAQRAGLARPLARWNARLNRRGRRAIMP
jgi:hypothetical protein